MKLQCEECGGPLGQQELADGQGCCAKCVDIFERELQQVLALYGRTPYAATESAISRLLGVTHAV